MPSASIEIGDRLPKLRLPRAGAEATVRPLRGRSREAVVVVALHDAGCGRCGDYLRALARAVPDFRLWDGVVRAVVDAEGPGPTAAAALQAELGSAVDVLLDDGRDLLQAVRATTGPVTLVADCYGQVFHKAAPEEADPHPVMAPRELEEWLKYLATQCPE